MKLIQVLRPLLTLAAAGVLASCAMEPFRTDGTGRGPSERMTFNVSLGTATKAVAPSAFDDGKKVDKLYAAAFDASGKLAAQKVADVNEAASSVTLTLIKGAAYKVVFFAMKEGQYNYSFADGNQASFSYKDKTYLANDPDNDAFYAVLEVKSASAKEENVILRRPFAQINVLSKNKPDGQTEFTSTMTVTAPSAFDLIGEKATGESQERVFASHEIDTEHLTSPSTVYPHWIGMNYVLVPTSSKKVTISAFKESGMSASITPGEVQVQPNYRTNLVGELYGDVDFSFTVHTGSGFEEEEEDIPYDSQDSQITIAEEGTFTENEPYAFDASPSGAKLTLNLLVNGHTFSTVDQYATDGGQVTAESQNPDIATAAVEGNQVVITPVANGKAEIVVSTPSYTKTDYRAQTFSFWVEITGVAEPEPPVNAGSDTIVFADLGLENGVQYSDPFEEGDMSVVFEGGDNDGKYYTTGTGIRIYGDGSVMVSSELEIIKIEYTFHSSYCPESGSFTVSSGEYDLSTHTWTGSATEVTLTRATGSGHWRLQKVTVYYGADHTDAILEHSAPGAYMPDHERAYAAGADQYLREYDGDALTFVLLNPDEDEQMVVSGFEKSCQKGSPVKVSVQWKKGTSSVLNGSWDMTVVKIEDGKAWLATRSGNGFIIKI